MKRVLCLLMTLALMTGLLSGCGRAIHNEAYVATGDAILMDGEESVVTEEAEDSQNLVLAYYPERSLNPLFGRLYQPGADVSHVSASVCRGQQEKHHPHSLLEVQGFHQQPELDDLLGG